MTTRTTSFITKLSSPDYEDFEALQVFGRAPIWYVAVTNQESEDAASARRRFFFTDILQALLVALGDGWVERALYIVDLDEDRCRHSLALERVEQVWDCSPRPAARRFEVSTSAWSRFMTTQGEPMRRSKRRHRLWPPTEETKA